MKPDELEEFDQARKENSGQEQTIKPDESRTEVQRQVETLVSAHCIGWRYNFKAGIEHCKHKEYCTLFHNYEEAELKWELKTKQWKHQKDFRKCEEWRGH